MSQGFSKDPSTHAEDSASASGDLLSAVASTRQDSLSVTSSTDGDYQPLKSSDDGSLWVRVSAALPAGNNNVGDVDVVSVVPGTAATNLGKAIDGAVGATDTGVAALAVRDDALTTLTPADSDYVPLRENARGALWIAIEDGAGAQVTSFGGGTQYTVDAVAPASPVGPTLVGERDDQLSTVTEAEGDWANVRTTSKGALWVAIADSSGDPITSFGGGTQYTEGDTDASITGTAMLWEDGSDTLRAVSAAKPLPVDTELPAAAALAENVSNPTAPAVGAFGMLWDGATWDRAKGDSTDGALVNLGSNNDVTVASGSITANAGSNLNTSLLALEAGGNLAAQTTSLQLIDDAVYTDDTSTHSTGTSKGLAMMAVATPTDASVNANDFGVPAMTTDRKLHVSVQDSLPAGSAAIGKLAANSGVDIGDVDVTSMVPGTGATSLGKAIDGAVGATDTGVLSLAQRTDAPATLTPADGDYVPFKVDSMGRQHVTQMCSTCTLSRVTDPGGTSVQLLAANASRRQATFFNESTNTLYLKMGTTASATSYNVRIASGGYYEMPLPCYVGRIDGIFVGAGGIADVQIGELT